MSMLCKTQRWCEFCKRDLGRTRKAFCNNACKQAAYRARKGLNTRWALYRAQRRESV